ncbi:MAG: hypothetical protein LAO22_06550 [Acidobacteriia bacterium]|nr:hypothetical protein [Terriglobia bacterium]
MRGRVLALVALLSCVVLPARAGGPAYIAGSGYDPGVKGQPIVWAGNYAQYFTDQGDLSPILTNVQADAFVASAFSPWTSVLDSAFTASQGGHLAEDVNSTNVIGYPNGTFSIPIDIQPTATAMPLGIVYDYDGAVTDALLGAGAGGVDYCFTNAVYGGPDNLNTAGNIVHALIVINGVCAASDSQLPDVQYRLVRTLGRVIGLGWSQANLNVITGNPPPTSADYEGFPLMHFTDPVTCVPIRTCYPDAAVLKMDDTASLVRLYPVTPHQPQKSPGPLVAEQPTARIHGSVYFTDASGNAVQPMQGVNVVARLLDAANKPSRQYVATSVSGFLFRGNAGNIINGFADGTGLRYDRWGSDDPALEGFFDLRGLVVPDGQNIALYQLSVEALDANWSAGVEPYDFPQVSPSGQFAPVVVTVQPASDVERDILMLQSEVEGTHPGSGATYANPASLPQGGGWASWVSGYGDTEWFQFAARADRTASVSVTALDESGNPTESKLMPVIGIWSLSDQSGGPAPASTQSAFNTFNFGMSRLDAQFSASDTFRLGMADSRGDGRPDYSYVASVLYADTVTPSRVSLAGGVLTLSGIGFNSGLQVSAAGNRANLLSSSATEIQVAVPSAALDGTATVQVTDPASGGFSRMGDALTYGAAADDQLLLLQGSEPATPVGSQAANPIRVQVVASDGVTPVNGATVAWSTTNSTVLSVCSGGISCSVLSDQTGESSTWVTPMAVGQSTITATVAPAAYPSPPSKEVALLATSSSLDLAAVAPTRWVGQGATLDVPLTVEALNAGVPQSNVVVNYTLTKGTATLAGGSATTNTSGYATVSVHLANHSADVQVSACVAPNNAPCQTFTLYATPASLWMLVTISGSTQVVRDGDSFQPLILRVTDSSVAANPVMGVNVAFTTTVARVPPGSGLRTEGDMIVGGTGMTIILGSSSTQAVTTEDGIASIVPTPGAARGPCDLFITVNAGPAVAQFDLQIVAAAREDLRRSERFMQGARLGGLQSSGVAGALLVAVPEGVSSGEPVVDLPVSACSDSSEDSADSIAQPCARSKPAKAKGRQRPVVPIGSGVAPTTAPAPAPAETQTHTAPRSQLPEDKRSCRVLAGDGTLP